MAVHETIRRVAAGSADDALAIPVIQGEFATAHLNRLIGTLQIRGARLKRDLPAGSRVEVMLHLDRSGQLHARADLPAVGESFEDVVHVLVPSASPEVLATELAAAETAGRRGAAARVRRRRSRPGADDERGRGAARRGARAACRRRRVATPTPRPGSTASCWI